MQLCLHSVDISWALLLNDKYKDLPAAIYSSEAEMLRFRHLVVNSVTATDSMDKTSRTCGTLCGKSLYRGL